MKKRFSDEQIISILREAESGVLPGSFAASTLSLMLRTTLGARSLMAWKCLR